MLVIILVLSAACHLPDTGTENSTQVESLSLAINLQLDLQSSQIAAGNSQLWQDIVWQMYMCVYVCLCLYI